MNEGNIYARQDCLVAVPLSQVCQLWRSAALSTSGAWARIVVSGSLSAREAKQIKTLLIRSCNQPLHVSISFLHRAKPVQAQLDLYAAVFKESYRWRTAYVDMFSQMQNCGQYISMINGLKGNLSQLETLVLDLWRDPSSSELLDNDAFAFCPRLRKVDLLTFHEKAVFPWNQLVWFNTEQAAALKAAIENGRAMKDLTINALDGEAFTSPVVDQHASIQRLVFPLWYRPGFLGHLVLPGLKELLMKENHISTEEYPGDEHFFAHELIPVLSHCSSTLQHLSISLLPPKSDVSIRSFQHLLQHLSSITSLNLSEHDLLDAHAIEASQSRLSSLQQDSSILANLRHFEYRIRRINTGVGALNLLLGTLENVLRSRVTPYFGSLQEFTLVVPQKSSDRMTQFRVMLETVSHESDHNCRISLKESQTVLEDSSSSRSGGSSCS